MKKIIATFALCCFATTAAMAADDIHKKFEGKWEWNKADSKFTEDASHPSPATITYKIIKADGKNYQYSDTYVMSDGKSTTETFDGKSDGQFYPITGSKDHEQDKVTQAADGTIVLDYKDDNGTGMVTCSLSSDGNKMTCNDKRTYKGKPDSGTYVLNRK